MSANPFLLAADNPSALLSLLREDPSLASGQDEHGYSLIHAAASYNHLDLLRTLVREYHVDVNLRDEDEESALFVVETVEAARVLVQELGADLALKGSDGVTAREKIADDGDYPEVAEYLRVQEAAHSYEGGYTNGGETNGVGAYGGDSALPRRHRLPGSTRVLPLFATTTNGVEPSGDATNGDDTAADPEIRRRIDELVAREDFHTEAGQAELRSLVQGILEDQNLDDRNVRRRQE